MMRRYGLPVLPLILGVILGPRLEKQLRTSLQLSDGHISGLWSEPVAVVVYVIVALVLVWPLLTPAARPAPVPRRGLAELDASDRHRATDQAEGEHADERRGGLRPDPGGRDRPRARGRRGPLARDPAGGGEHLARRRAGRPEVRRRRAALRAASSGSTACDHTVVHAMRGLDASEEILAVAREHRAELVVIGLRRRSPVGKLLMGSTAQRVLLDAHCPVLAVKP